MDFSDAWCLFPLGGGTAGAGLLSFWIIYGGWSIIDGGFVGLHTVVVLSLG